MKRFKSYCAALVLAASLLTLTATEAAAAAPTVSRLSTTELTANGRTSQTYTGYMNGQSFQQEGITSHAGWQYTAFWDAQGRVNVSRRALPSGTWQTVTLTDYTTGVDDTHNTISLGVSAADGTLHLAFDMHSSRLRYRKSVPGLVSDPARAAWTAGSFGTVQNGLTGTPLDTVTYPAFIAAPGGGLQLSLRTGTSGAGDQVLYEYARGTWTGIGQFVNGTAAGNNAYFFGLEYDDAGVLLGTWTVRETSNASTNHDLYFAYSNDRGRTWRNNAGAVVGTAGSAPIAASAAAVRVWSIGQNRGLINQESQVVDSTGVVHVLASHLPASAPSTGDFTAARQDAVLVHYHRDKATGTWRQTYTPFLERLSRGDIAVDSADNLYVVSGDSVTRKLHIETASRASRWTDWTLRHTSGPDYFSDPLIDHEDLRAHDRMTLYTPRYGGSRIEVQTWQVRP